MVSADQVRAAAALSDPANLEAILAQKAAETRAVQADARTAPQEPDLSACAVGMDPGAPPLSSEEFRSTSGQIEVIQGQCVHVYVGYLGVGHEIDGGVFVTYLTVDGSFTSNEWPFPGQGPLTLSKLTAGGIATLVPATGKPFTLDITKQ